MTEATQSFHIVIGMPGSGKTTYLERLLAEGAVDCYFDDYQKGAPKDETTEGRRKSDPRLSPNYTELKAGMSAGKNVAIADIRYCLPEEQSLIQAFAATEFPEAKVVLTYFANDPEACRHNVQLRARQGRIDKELENIDMITAQYHPPQNQVVPVIMG